MEVYLEEDVVLVFFLCIVIMRLVVDFGGKYFGNLFVCYWYKEYKLGCKDWNFVVLEYVIL